MAEDDDTEKSEDPTHRRLEDAKKEGQVPFSREVVHFGMLLVLAFLVGSLAPGVMRTAYIELQGYVMNADALHLDGNSAHDLIIRAMLGFGHVMLVPLIFSVFMALFSALAQNGLVISAKSLTPQLSRISPLSGFSRIFSFRSLLELFKGLIKISLVGIVGFVAVYPELLSLSNLHTYTPLGIMIYVGKLALKLMIGMCIVMFFIAVLDFLYQRHEYMKNLRMSRQDIKDEFRRTEGNPEIRSKLREIRRERAKGRMMSNVPKSDVVVTNPTHFAVALQYDPAVRDAPIVSAKGADHIALRIRDVAKENKVPIVENPPLARALFDSTEIGDEIPLQHYQAVAEVIRYVYDLKKKTG